MEIQLHEYMSKATQLFLRFFFGISAQFFVCRRVFIAVLFFYNLLLFIDVVVDILVICWLFKDEFYIIVLFGVEIHPSYIARTDKGMQIKCK